MTSSLRRPSHAPPDRDKPAMYTQIFDPIGHSLGLSTIVAVLPLLTLFVL